jgi:anti-sigma factor RsiW
MSQACAGWRDDIGAYVLGALDPDENAQVRRHLESCAACRADYHDLLPVRDWLASLAPDGALPPGHFPGGPRWNRFVRWISNAHG